MLSILYATTPIVFTFSVKTGLIYRRKCKKKKSKKKGQAESEEVKMKQSVDDILDTLTAEAGNLSVGNVISVRNEQEQSLFGVQLKFANADKEMKRIFGVGRGRGWLLLRQILITCVPDSCL